MKRIVLSIAVLLFAVTSAFSQIHNPVKWEVASKKVSATEAVVYVKAIIQNGWHIYGMGVPENGPQPTAFTFAKSNDYTLVGKTAEQKPKSKYEDVFKMDVPYHNNQVVFQQKVKLNSKKQTKVSGVVEFMACDKTQCLPPDEYSFVVTIK